MNDAVKKELNDAIAIISSLSVSGDAVDVIAAVKSKVRRAIGYLEEHKEDCKNG